MNDRIGASIPDKKSGVQAFFRIYDESSGKKTFLRGIDDPCNYGGLP